MDDLLRGDPVAGAAESHISFAAYWRSPLNYTAYVANNVFLADINNERAAKNATYKKNLMSLNRMALLVAEKDDIVIPRTSPWFSFYDTAGSGSDSRVLSYYDTPLYTEDWIGLKALKAKIVRWAVNCTHQNVPRDSCKEESYDNVTKALLDNFLPAK